MSEDEIREHDLNEVKAACDRLSKTFESIQIFVSRHEGGEVGTRTVHWGMGDWYSRYGFVQLWVKNQQAVEATTAIKAITDP